MEYVDPDIIDSSKSIVDVILINAIPSYMDEDFDSFDEIVDYFQDETKSNYEGLKAEVDEMDIEIDGSRAVATTTFVIKYENNDEAGEIPGDVILNKIDGKWYIKTFILDDIDEN